MMDHQTGEAAPLDDLYPSTDRDAHLADPPPPPCLHWVALYLVSLAWGGPAEGGWFYNSGELVTDPALYARLGALPAAFLGDAEAEAHAARMSKGIAVLNEGWPPKHSVLSEGVYEVHVLEAGCLLLHWPEDVPRYG